MQRERKRASREMKMLRDGSGVHPPTMIFLIFGNEIKCHLKDIITMSVKRTVCIVCVCIIQRHTERVKPLAKGDHGMG